MTVPRPQVHRDPDLVEDPVTIVLDDLLDDLDVGAAVEVRRRFDDAWARGFAVASIEDGTYRLRRSSDGAVLPVTFPRSDLRRRHP